MGYVFRLLNVMNIINLNICNEIHYFLKLHYFYCFFSLVMASSLLHEYQI
jgi:hypothetical protein